MSNKPKKNSSTSQAKPSNINVAMRNALIALGVVLLLGAIGYALFEQNNSDHVDTSQESETLEFDDEGVEFSNELPDNFPNEVPLYEPAEISTASEVDHEEEIVWSIAYDTGSSVTEVYEFYESSLDSNGWSVESSFASDDVQTIGAHNEAANLQVQLSISADELNNRTSYSLTAIKTTE